MTFRRVVERVLIGGKLNPVRAAAFDLHGIGGDELPRRIKLQYLMAAVGLADVGITQSVEDDRLRVTVIATAESAQACSRSAETVDLVRLEARHVQVAVLAQRHSRVVECRG